MNERLTPEAEAETLRQVADALEAINPVTEGLSDGKWRVRPEIRAVVDPLGAHPVEAAPNAIIALPNVYRRWWLAAAALKLRQEADRAERLAIVDELVTMTDEAGGYD